MRLVRAIAAGDADETAKLVESSPALPQQRLEVGATRQRAAGFFLEEIEHYLYSGDTPLHVAAASYQNKIAEKLIKHEADVSAVNRRGAQPLHYAADGGPGARHWNPGAQGEMIALLIHHGADPNALDKSGVAPLHRAVRQRCLGAVEALLRNRSHVRLQNKGGSTPLHLAVQNTGRGGTGSPEAREMQRQIIIHLLEAGANPEDRDGKGKTVRDCAQSDWIRALL